jgi:two-component system LytT family response regulator
MLTAVIVDDEPVARRRLMRLLEAHAKAIRVVAESNDTEEARALLEEHSPDALFLDVEMSGEDGLAFASRLERAPFIVFTTAHQHFALDAFKANTIDYLLKPVSPEDLARAVRKLTERNVPTVPRAEGQDHPCPMEQILVDQGQSLRPLPIGHITYFESRDKYTTIHTVDGAHDIQVSLTTLEERLPARRFLRIHRSHIVNVSFIRELKRLGTRQLELVLSTTGQEHLVVSRRHVDSVLKSLGSLA